jgi:hypothetical protein
MSEGTEFGRKNEESRIEKSEKTTPVGWFFA